MKELSVIMALVDFIPVAFFAVAAIVLQRNLYNKMSKGAFALFSMGTLDIVFAGFAKALYKLLYGASICDFQALSDMFFPVQSIGFLMAGVAAVAMIHYNQSSKTLFSVAPPLFSGTLIFVSFMCLGLGLLYYALCVIAIKMKKPMLILVFVLSFFMSLCMGYLSTKDFSLAIYNWIAQGVNIVGQGLLLWGALSLRKAGLWNLKLK
ncbi:hypothetical protein [Pseudobutyrivibrio xylanivorans]|uniref:Lysoplasmalogenase n=1 Tax=Pseudobutyrivibrio xylanivorans TaxID=185007 RepID=A0A1G5S2T0_PSEXY|nr:hypothetical protein [Pseudobutyrivibrio xylanivorans]SCZ80478.1 hypothetical protein SAMN02910350_02312 [Pseudobutyrivibrio xylanivorans]